MGMSTEDLCRVGPRIRCQLSSADALSGPRQSSARHPPKLDPIWEWRSACLTLIEANICFMGGLATVSTDNDKPSSHSS